jgi:hypothetical protein
MSDHSLTVSQFLALWVTAVIAWWYIVHTLDN